jgi:hypothetical protein
VLVNLEAVNASPAVHTAALKNKTSFAINCPGIGDRHGNPYSGCHTPGVESKKVKVTKNMIIAPKLPNYSEIRFLLFFFINLAQRFDKSMENKFIFKILKT